jgi:hypothetical protein
MEACTKGKQQETVRCLVYEGMEGEQTQRQRLPSMDKSVYHNDVERNV